VPTVSRLNLWTLWWNSERLLHGYRGYWHAPIFAGGRLLVVIVGSPAAPTTPSYRWPSRPALQRMPVASNMYAVYSGGARMPTAAGLKRKSFFVDTRALRRARKALGVATEAEAVRRAIERVAEMEAFWRFMTRTRGRLKPGSFRRP